jgi:outer membrane immunogenic protein
MFNKIAQLQPLPRLSRAKHIIGLLQIGGTAVKRLSTAIAAIALIGTPAFAADMGVPSAPPPAPVYNWTGWYVGVNAGASFGNVKTDFNAPVTVTTSVFGGPFAGQVLGPGTFGFAGSDTTSPNGFMGGGQIGYNWQWSPLIVIGLEADFQGALERDSSTLTGPFHGSITSANFVNPISGSTVLDYQTKIDWFGTVRARIGYVWGNGNVMSYLSGGLAYGEVKINGTSTSSGTNDGEPPFSVTQAFGHSQVNTGWVVGYGTEGVIDFWGAHNWTWKIEGLYMDLGHLDATGPGASFSVLRTTGSNAPVLSTATGQVTTNSHFTDGILRAGLNYKFY